MVYAALFMLMLLGFTGLAVDTSRLLKVRNELQNAADAAALKGARFLFKAPSVPGDPPVLDFDGALAMAQDMIKYNSSENQALADAEISVGYWNLAWDSSTFHDLQPKTIIPTTQDIPAVRVVVKRAEGSNGGQVNNFFLKALGIGQSAVGSSPAVAMSGYLGSVPPNDLFPVALSECLTDQYFSQVPLPDPPPTIQITSPYGAGGTDCYTGQWTSFLQDANDVPTIQELIDNGNPTQLGTGDSIWVQPGAKASLFNYVSDWLPPGGKDVVLAIVEGGGSDFSTKGHLTVTGFATFHIDGAVGGSDKYIYGHFINYFTTPPGTRPGGGVSNTVTPPVMVQ